MNISLLDVLSCGLAAMVILLLLSLNTGAGNNDKIDENTSIEISLLNFQTSNEVIIKTPKKKSIHASIVPTLLTKSICELSFEKKADSLNRYVYFNQLSELPKQKLFIQLSKGANEFVLKFRLKNLSYKNGKIQFSVTKTASGKTKIFDFESHAPSISLEVNYNHGVKISIDTLAGTNPIFKSF